MRSRRRSTTAGATSCWRQAASASPARGTAGRARAAAQGRRAGAGARTQDLRVGGRGKTLAGVGVRQRVARSRELVAEGDAPSVVARVAGISRQALYRTPTLRRLPQRRPPADPVEAAIVA